jgi:hypothetical protein
MAARLRIRGVRLLSGPVRSWARPCLGEPVNVVVVHQKRHVYVAPHGGQEVVAPSP